MASKYVLCRPEGGLGDIFNQIWPCCVYAREYDRTLVIDTISTDFQDDFFRYFRPLVPIIQPFASIAERIGSMTVHPPQLARDGLVYDRIFVPPRGYRRHFFAPSQQPDLDLTLDFTRRYDED